MTPRWWPGLRPSLSTGLALALAEQPGPKVMASATVALTSEQNDARRPLSWDREDAALASGECPWHPDLDFPDSVELVRHIIRHARVWEAEAMQTARLMDRHSEQVRRFTQDVMARFTADVEAMAASILGDAP